jgi:hypothetical protein
VVVISKFTSCKHRDECIAERTERDRLKAQLEIAVEALGEIGREDARSFAYGPRKQIDEAQEALARIKELGG